LEAFAALALPFTEKWNAEVGANISKLNEYAVFDATLGDSNGVRIPRDGAALVDVHTHPRGSPPGMSGPIYYNVKPCAGFCAYAGDMGTNYERHTEGYVFRAGGGEWHFREEAFRRDVDNAERTSSPVTLSSTWPQYMEQLK
jgi:hypothetical protein